MNVLAALVILTATAGVTLAEQVTCQHFIRCPCGSTNKNVTVCMQERRKDICSRWSECKTCQDGLNRCLECPEGSEGPLCKTVTRRGRLYRQKRQLHSHPHYDVHSRRPNSPYQQSPANGYPASRVKREDLCPVLNSPKLGSIRCLTNGQQRTCVGTCLPGYSFEGRGSDNEVTLTCTHTEGHFTPLREFPPCKSGGYCDMIVQGAGSYNCTTVMTGTRCDVICDGRHTGRYFCYPGEDWEPQLPYCMRPKGVKEDPTCRCEYGGTCDRNGNCVCPVGRMGRFCERPAPDTSLTYCPDPGVDPNGSRNPDSSPNHQGFPQGTRLQYSCNPGYDIDGERSIFCLLSGKWTSENPKCNSQSREPGPDTSKKFCRDPGLDPNGSRKPPSPSNHQGFPQGTQLEFFCNQGYILEGEENMFCLASGEWLSERPRCSAQSATNVELAYCLNPGTILNGRVVYYPPLNNRQELQPQTDLDDSSTDLDDPEFPYGGRMEYTCDSGFILEGSSTLICQADENWSAEKPVCRESGRSFIRTTPSKIHVGNGDKTAVGDRPRVVTIAMRQNDFTGQVICGGAAAHCLLQARQFSLYFRKYYHSTSLDDTEVLN